MAGLSHLDEQGRARMVDVGDKAESRRECVARAAVRMAPATLAAITPSWPVAVSIRRMCLHAWPRAARR